MKGGCVILYVTRGSGQTRKFGGRIMWVVPNTGEGPMFLEIYKHANRVRIVDNGRQQNGLVIMREDDIEFSILESNYST